MREVERRIWGGGGAGWEEIVAQSPKTEVQYRKEALLKRLSAHSRFEVDVFKRMYVKPWPLELITLSYATPNCVELPYAEKLVRIPSNKLHGLRHSLSSTGNRYQNVNKFALHDLSLRSRLTL